VHRIVATSITSAIALAGACTHAQTVRSTEGVAQDAKETSLLAAPGSAPAVRDRASEPSVQRALIEDDRVRIEELRVRGQVRRLVVQPKVEGVRAYEIEPPDPGRDTTAARGGSGQRVWRVLGF
jgi:hypothetical protein